MAEVLSDTTARVTVHITAATKDDLTEALLALSREESSEGRD